MNNQMNNDAGSKENHPNLNVLDLVTDVVSEKDDINPSNETLTEGLGKLLIQRDQQFAARLILPSEWNTHVKTWDLIEMPFIENESNDNAIKRRTEENCEDSPMTELFLHLKLLELRYEFDTDRDTGIDISSTRTFKESLEITEFGRKIGIEFDISQQHLIIPIARRRLIKITEIEIQSEDIASIRFDWSWEPNNVWKALDPRLTEHQVLSAPIRERMDISGLSRLIPIRLKRIGKGVGDFFNTENGWQLFDTTFEDMPV